VRTEIRTCHTCGVDVSVTMVAPMGLGGAPAMPPPEFPVWCSACEAQNDAEEAEVEAQRKLEKAAARRVEVSGIPGRWKGLAFSDVHSSATPEQMPALDAAAAWVQGHTPGLLLWGKVGRGKSLTAAVAASQMCGSMSVRWLSVSQVLRDLSMPFGSREFEAAQRSLRLPRYKGRRVAMVLDDLDKTKPTDHSLQPLFAAIDAWVGEDFPLLVTSNADPTGFAEWGGDRFGVPIASRLAGFCNVVEVAGVDRRLHG
jgi:DNA replication protein DnaC